MKLLQIGLGERPSLVSAVEIPVPDAIRQDPDQLFAFYASELPKALKDGHFKGRKVVSAVPSAQTFIQHMQLAATDGLSCEDLMKAQLQMKLGCSPRGVVVRPVEVIDVHRDGQAKTEMICFAITRERVMRFVELLKKCKLRVAGVHTETIAMVRAFDHLNRRKEDHLVTTLYVDVGWGGTRVAISHGKEIRFARYIPIGGRHFDTLVAGSLHCDLTSARAHRLSMRSSHMVVDRAGHRKAADSTPGGAILASAMAQAKKDGEDAEGRATPTTEERRSGQRPPELGPEVTPVDQSNMSADIDLRELLDTVADELSMCLRYHRGLFPDRRIDRAIFLGGESRQVWMCQHVVKVLQLPGQLGDPLARLVQDDNSNVSGPVLGEPQPGWAVACGLCTSPTDL